jgi:amidophosphoribosyltransferase
MGGLFGIASQDDCVNDLYYGTDYHSHMGTKRGGLTVLNDIGFKRYIHDISQTQFRSKFHDDIKEMHGRIGIGVISDFDDQPLIIGSHLGVYAIVTVGRINNIQELAKKAFDKGTTHYSEMSGGQINPTEMVATLIDQGASFQEGIEIAQNAIEGSLTLLILTDKGIYASRDKLGRTPLVIGKRSNAYAVAMESTAFPNLNFELESYLGPGEIVFITHSGVEKLRVPNKRLQICAFFWVYYGYPASYYEGINVEDTRYRCGVALAKNDCVKPDCVSGIPDSGTSHGIGYANESKIPFTRPFVKYTPTWPRSFMPQEQSTRDLVAKMKLIPIKDLIIGKKILFCDDSIVRGTQLKDTIKRIYDCGAKEVHMRVACPPLVYGCKFLNFSRSKSDYDLAARYAINEIEGEKPVDLKEYLNPDSVKYKAMIEWIRKRMHLTSLKYQKLDDLVKAIGLPKERLCTYCWDGVE